MTVVITASRVATIGYIAAVWAFHVHEMDGWQ